MRLLQRAFLLTVVGFSAVILSGCPLLMIGGLGYSGYQYKEKEGVFAPGQPLGGSAPDPKNDKSDKSSKPSSGGDNSIE